LGSSITTAFERTAQWSSDSKGQRLSISSKMLLQSHLGFFGEINGYLLVGILHIKSQTSSGDLTKELWKMIPASYKSLPATI